MRLHARDVRLAPVAPPVRVPTGRDPGLGRPLVLAVGRLHPQKGYDVLLEALPLLGDAVVAVAGDGPLREELQARAPQVRWLGARDDVADLYAAADVVVLPSAWEARSLTAQEALLAGRPLVATAVGGLPGLLRDGAVLVPPGDPVALGTAVRRLLDDPVAAAALAERGRAVAAGWPTADDAVTQAAGPVPGAARVRRLLWLLPLLLVLLPAPAHAAEGTRVVLVGAPGLRWDDVGPQTPALTALAARGSTGALSVRSASPRTCPADGWVMAATGNRARAGRPSTGACSDVVPGPEQLPALRRDNATLRFDAEVGALGRVLQDRGTLVATSGGPGAALVAADARGEVDAPASGAADLTVVDAGAVHHDARRAADLARVDAVVAGLPRDAVVLLAGLADTSDRGEDAAPVPRLHVVVAAGGSFDGRHGLVSASTRRAPYVQVVDLAPTVLRLLGVPQPATMTGQPVRTGERTDRAGLVDLDRHAGAMRRYTPRFFVLLVVAQVLVYGAALLLHRRHESGRLRDRARRAAHVGALAATAAPVSTYLADLLPWWRADPVLPALLAAVALFDVLVVAAALAGPWRRRLLGPVGVVCGTTAVVLAGDLLTGARLQMSSLAGYSPLVAGRFAGVGNVAFAVFASAALLATACLLDGRGRRTALVGCGAVGAFCVVVDGGPSFGSDFGGVLALVPGFALLGMLAGGVRVSALRLVAVGAAAVGLVTTFAVLDWTRPDDRRTHLGRFVQQVLDGDAGTVLQRKAAANLGLLTSSVLTLLVPLLVLFVAQVVLRPRGPVAAAFARAPVWRHGLVSVLVMSLVGFAVNDSGVAVPALALCVAVPAAVAVAVRASSLEAAAPR